MLRTADRISPRARSTPPRSTPKSTTSCGFTWNRKSRRTSRAECPRPRRDGSALRDFGGVTQTREAVRDVRTIWLDSVWRDAAARRPRPPRRARLHGRRPARPDPQHRRLDRDVLGRRRGHPPRTCPSTRAIGSSPSASSTSRTVRRQHIVVEPRRPAELSRLARPAGRVHRSGRRERRHASASKGKVRASRRRFGRRW